MSTFYSWLVLLILCERGFLPFSSCCPGFSWHRRLPNYWELRNILPNGNCFSFWVSLWKLLNQSHSWKQRERTKQTRVFGDKARIFKRYPPPPQLLPHILFNVNSRTQELQYISGSRSRDKKQGESAKRTRGLFIQCIINLKNKKIFITYSILKRKERTNLLEKQMSHFLCAWSG